MAAIDELFQFLALVIGQLDDSMFTHALQFTQFGFLNDFQVN